MILRLCLKDKTSVLIKNDIEDITYQTNHENFITVINYNTGKREMYNSDYIWCVRQSSEGSE